MQTSVAVRLRVRDVVVVFLRENREVFLHDGEHFVALLDRAHDDAKRPHVEELVEAQVLSLHLLPDRIDVLRTPGDISLNAVSLEERPHLFDRVLHEFETFLSGFVEFVRDLAVFLGTREAQRQVLELPLDLPDAETIGKRRINRERFRTELLRALRSGRRKPPKRLEAARELEEHHAQVLTHCEEHATKSLRLHGGARFLAFRASALREVVHFAQLCNKPGNGASEALRNPVFGVGNELRNAVEVRRSQKLRIVADADKDFADFKTMFNQFDEGEPSFTEEEQERWMQSCPLEEIPGSSALQTVPPMLPKRIRCTRQIAVRWIAAASVAAACFFLGTTVSRKEATQPTNSISIPPTVLTEVKWKTDTVFIEKPVPTTLTAKIITVRDTIVLPASHPKGQMWAALSTGQDTSSTETASIPLSDTALQDADTAARQQTMPHLADIQAEFQKQKRRMDEFSKQYEINIPPYENVY